MQTGLMVGAGVPVAQIEALVLAGLPEEVDRVVNGRSISFLLRAVPYDLDYAPPAILDAEGRPTRAGLDGWWARRAIPPSCARARRLMAELNVDSTLALAEKNFGLSLSDRYWIDDPQNPQAWADINFFDNDFTEDLGRLTLGQDSSSENPNLMSPNSTVGGDLNKKWTILNGVRVLVKSGTGFVNQEGKRTYCACPNMLGEDEELVPALHIIQNRKKPNTMNDYQFLVSCLESLGLREVEIGLSKMFTCDFIVGNYDRHYQNFGVIRNVETLEYTRLAPVFDTGNSLWCNVESLDVARDYDYLAKPFGRGLSPVRQLQLLSRFDWFRPEKLEGFAAAEAGSILAGNPNMPPARIERIVAGVERQVETALRVIEGSR